MLTKIMLGMVIVIAPFYLLAAYNKDERRNTLVAACQSEGHSKKDCRALYEHYRPLPK